ncbi:MAG: hypothetical protein R3F20_06255 [Planctomycetota bacterium]
MCVAAVWPVEDVAANYPMALDAKQNLLFVGCRQPAKLLVLDSRDGSRLETLDCGGDADDLFIDETNGRVYVACGEGGSTCSRPSGRSSHTLLHSIETVSGARTALWDPKGRRLFLATPRRGDAVATIRVYEAP